MNHSSTRWKREVEILRRLIEEAQEALFEEASNIAGDHWRAAANHEEGDRKDRSNYMIRVARGRAGVHFHWKKTWVIWDRKQGKFVQRSRYIKLGEGKLRHQLTSFPNAKDWERPIIESVEARAAHVRAKTKWLARLAMVLSNHPDLERERQEAARARKAEAAAEAEALPEEIGW